MDTQQISNEIINDCDGFIATFPDEVRNVAETKVQEIIDAGDEDVAEYFGNLKHSGCSSAMAVRYLLAGYLAAIQIAYDNANKEKIDVINQYIEDGFDEMIHYLPISYMVIHSGN